MTKPNNDSLDGILYKHCEDLTDVQHIKLRQAILATHRPISEIEAAIPKKKAETEKELESLDVVERYEYLNYPCFSRYDMDSEHDRAIDQIRKALGISAERGE